MSDKSPAPQRWRVEPGLLGTRRRLAAQLNAWHFRSLRLATLQVLVLTSLPLWLHVHAVWVPGWLAWLALLVEGGGLALVVAYAALEWRWHRLTRRSSYPPRAVVHVVRTPRERVRTGSWAALASASLLPWASTLAERPLPARLLGPLTISAALLAGSLLVAEMIRAVLRREAPAFRRVIDTGSEAQPRGAPRRRMDDAS